MWVANDYECTGVTVFILDNLHDKSTITSKFLTIVTKYLLINKQAKIYVVKLFTVYPNTL